jgi:metal-dependent amidase/aminoacylase/carboxypeptidase family protein
MLEWSESGFSVPIPAFMAAMHFRTELFCTWPRVMRSPCDRVAEVSEIRVKVKAASAHFAAPKMTRNMACLTVAVMLHLRACYVSKAAILTVPVSLVPVENRSPA